MFVCVYRIKYSRVFKASEYISRSSAHQSSPLFFSFQLFSLVLVQYGQRRIVIVVTENLRTTVKDAFEIANESDIVLQLYDEEWIIVN